LKYDENRTAFLEAHGLRVLRFTNVEVLTNPAGVLEVIWEAVGGDETAEAVGPPSP
jgi:very-short-patch-repair endonuclease